MTTMKMFIGRTLMIALAIFGVAFFALIPAVLVSMIIVGLLGLEEGSTAASVTLGAIFAPLFVIGSIGAVQEVLKEER